MTRCSNVLPYTYRFYAVEYLHFVLVHASTLLVMPCFTIVVMARWLADNTSTYSGKNTYVGMIPSIL